VIDRSAPENTTPARKLRARSLPVIDDQGWNRPSTIALPADDHAAAVERDRDRDQQQQHDQRAQGQHLEHRVALLQLLDQRVLDGEQQQRAGAEQDPGDGLMVIVQ